MTTFTLSIKINLVVKLKSVKKKKTPFSLNTILLNYLHSIFLNTVNILNGIYKIPTIQHFINIKLIQYCAI